MPETSLAGLRSSSLWCSTVDAEGKDVFAESPRRATEGFHSLCRPEVALCDCQDRNIFNHLLTPLAVGQNIVSRATPVDRFLPPEFNFVFLFHSASFSPFVVK